MIISSRFLYRVKRNKGKYNCTVTKLTEEKRRVLERLMRDNEEAEKIPISERIPVSNPDKYTFPVGFDDNGKPFPITHEEKM